MNFVTGKVKQVASSKFTNINFVSGSQCDPKPAPSAFLYKKGRPTALSAGLRVNIWEPSFSFFYRVVKKISWFE